MKARERVGRARVGEGGWVKDEGGGRRAGVDAVFQM